MSHVPVRPHTVRPPRLIAWALAAVLGATALWVPAAAVPGWTDTSTLAATGVITPTTDSASAVSTASDAAGNAVAAWATAGAIMVARRPAEGAWSAPEVLAATPEMPDSPQVHMNPDGRTVVAWAYPWISVSNTTNGGVWARTTTPGQPWGPVLRGAPDTTRGRLVTDMGPDGSLHAAWQGGFTATSITLTPGDQWGALTHHQAPGCDLSAPTAIAAEGDGSVSVLTTGWHPLDANGVQWWCTYVDRASASGTWEPIRILDPDSSGQASLTAAADGTVHATWVSSRGVVYAGRSADGTWKPDEVLRPAAATAGAPLSGPRVAMDTYGGLSVVWSEGAPTTRTIRARTRLPGSTWGSVINVSQSGSHTSDARLVALESGSLHASWLRITPEGPLVESASRDGETAWNSVVALGPGASPDQSTTIDSLSPSAATDGTGNLLYGWARDQDGQRATVHLRSLDAAGPRFTSVSVPQQATVGALHGFTAEARDAWSGFSAMNWDFGDGTTTTGTSVSHTYAAPGAYAVTVTAVDTLGNVTRSTHPVTVIAASAARSAITKFTLSSKRLRLKGPAKKRKVKAHITLEGPARVTLTWKKWVVKKTKKGKKRVLKTVARSSYTLVGGKNSLTLKAKVGKKKLKPGKYVLVASSTNSKKAKLRITR